MQHRDTVHFYLNGKAYSVKPASPTQTLLQYLREDLRLIGTKEGCAEGDCGACTVTEAALQPDGSLAYRAVNACIRFLPMVDGKVLWTVEALGDAAGQLHPVQQAMVDHHGSQCGFCTPGFVMSLYTMYRKGLVRPDREQVLDHLSGNLCRCTGYRPIIDAALDMHAYEPVVPDDDLVHGQLAQLRERCAATLVIVAGGSRYIAPTTTSELAEAVLQDPDAVVLAGGTDVGLWVTKQLKTLPNIISVGAVQALHEITLDDDGLRIGAGVLLEEGYEAVVAEYPEATELWKRFASMPIRNAGTLVGNLANGSPIGDTAPLLIALGAKVVLRKGAQRRSLNLDALYLDYRKQQRDPGEFLEEVWVPRRKPGVKVATYKLSKRFDQDISAVCSAYALTLDNNRVKAISIAHGGMAPTSRRAPRAEQALLGRSWNEGNVRQAMQALEDDYQPMTDMRASSDYRLKAARNLLYRFYLESTGVDGTRV